MASKNEFGTKIGLIAATVGSAVGLGNVWRFPAETQTNGGAAFLLLYILCVLLLGIPVMLAEFSLGRGGRSDTIGVFKKLSPGSKWWLTGLLAVIASYIIICYYMVVAGWTLEYFIESVSGGLYDSLTDADSAEALHGTFAAKMDEYVSSDMRPLLFTYAMIALNIAVLLGGVRKGIENLSNVLMPLLFVILLVLCFITLSLPGSGEGVKFFLTPDFSRITPATVVNALGQAFFSLSLGMGILITYSSYYPGDTKLVNTSVIVSLLSLLVAVLMGLIIFPAVKSFGLDSEPLKGATLVFVTLPEVFANLPAPQVWSSLFFLLLLVAALTSTISIAEVSVKMMIDRFRLSRKAGVLIVMLPLLALSAVCSLSFGSLSDFRIFGLTVFDLFDHITTNVFLPLVSLGVCIYMGWFAPKHLLSDELSNKGTLRSPLTGSIQFIIKYVAPILIATILISNYL
jgi:NSS family neurotransmitter:Na+ symporter